MPVGSHKIKFGHSPDCYLWWLCLGLCCHFSSCFIDNLCDTINPILHGKNGQAKRYSNYFGKFWSWAEIRAPMRKIESHFHRDHRESWRAFFRLTLNILITLKFHRNKGNYCFYLCVCDSSVSWPWNGELNLAYGYRCSQENVEWGWDMPNASHFHLIELPFSQVFQKRNCLRRIFQGTVRQLGLHLFSVKKWRPRMFRWLHLPDI